MRVGRLLLVFFVIVFLFLVFSRVIVADDCPDGTEGCLSGPCLSDETCYEGICDSDLNWCTPSCQVETQEQDCDDGDPNTVDSCVNYVCVHSVSFSPNGVCEYGKGERIGDSTRLINGKLVDDCDQDGDDKYDSCGLLT